MIVGLCLLVSVAVKNEKNCLCSSSFCFLFLVNFCLALEV